MVKLVKSKQITFTDMMKKRASAFYGTLLAGLVDGFRTIAIRECSGDRVSGAVAWNLYDIDAKFADVQSVD